MAVKITSNQRRFLDRAVRGWDGMAEQSITHPSYTALDKRGLVTWRVESDNPHGGRWVPTDAGRAALAQF